MSEPASRPAAGYDAAPPAPPTDTMERTAAVIQGELRARAAAAPEEGQRDREDWGDRRPRRKEGGPRGGDPRRPDLRGGDPRRADPRAPGPRAPGGRRILDTSSGREDGMDRCPRCGGTDFRYLIEARSLVCGHCRARWNEPVIEGDVVRTAIRDLRGTVRGSATADLRHDADLVTLKCPACGAEVVITTERGLTARCHWCRQQLTVHQQIPNGAAPDAILPFLVPHAAAVQAIRDFVGRRSTFALPRFRQEFVPENVMGVYLPYMLVDGNMVVDMRGRGEVLTRRRVVRSGKTSHVEYDADVYELGRRLFLTVDDLAAAASAQRADRDTSRSTNNVIDTIQPFDTAHAVRFSPHYLRGFSAERRDLDLNAVSVAVGDDFLAIARERARPSLTPYDRGVSWRDEGLGVIGSRWLAIHLPVWLYSYRAVGPDGAALVHYIAVNGRTGETMGSVPVSHGRIAAAAGAAGLGAFLLTLPLVLAAFIPFLA